MRWSQGWNTLQICPCRDSNSDGSELWANVLPVRPQRHPAWTLNCIYHCANNEWQLLWDVNQSLTIYLYIVYVLSFVWFRWLLVFVIIIVPCGFYLTREDVSTAGLVVQWATVVQHYSSNLSLAISEGCFISPHSLCVGHADGTGHWMAELVPRCC